ncbi:RagB/SusD family nutrient uptake outer membrane protein [Proteiniphilum sp. X52]|uniref:RagB/SusD family nutrient uptake outer membrane protein n=1 Tax=Proteiniphilum sp. X52 TaxID=2382159 RepID=UPI000F0A25C9|nr:RagB/SusD family nutrient uptake outer membrane protein [Proteiniphilum sp. X52]RNC63381.1 RagB/SusD family nutrient uptake outer membrane protein [Proteiniphilum sp. X52]
MKKFLRKEYIPFIIGLSFCFQSCNFLDIDPYITDLFTIDTLFIKKEYTQKYLNNVYSYLIDNGINVAWSNDAMPYSLISDEGVAGYDQSKSNHNYNAFCNNLMTPEKLYSIDKWDRFYEGIRKANTFIMRVNDCEEAGELKRSEWIGEATFIKACLYFELMLAWGPVPIMPDKPVDFDTPIDQMFVERNTWDECSDYVASLLETAIKLLPSEILDNSEVGKPTKYSAMAVLSRLSLYTASPLFNGENKEFENSFKNNAGVPYLNPVQNNEKWAIAAANAKRLVNLKPNDLYTVPKMDNTPYLPVPEEEQADFPKGVGGIDPYHSYADMFNGECVLASSNCEILFSRQNSSVNTNAQYTAPWVIGGWGVYFIPQNLVDAYYMIDGRTIDNASETYPYESGLTDTEVVFSGNKTDKGFTILSGTCKWYVNREMRFYATVAYNNSYYPSISTPPDKIDQRDGKVAKFFFDSKSGKSFATWKVNKEEYPMSGYLCKKYIHYEDSWLPDGRVKKKYNLVYRMAEVYLNYVEAMNELDKSYTINDITVSRDVKEMKRCFNLIRYRAGLPGITDADVADVARMRKLILRERQIEMAWENRRYFDLRRTKQAVYYENETVKGCDVSAKESEPDKFYTVVKVREKDWIYKIFTDRQTFFPIPKHEIDKNPNLDQFPGY